MEKTYLKMLIYGEPGTGKTAFIGTAADDKRFGNILLIDLEAGFQSIASKCQTIELSEFGKHKPNDKITRVRIKTFDAFKDLLELIDEKVYQTVLIDSLSEINYQNLQNVTERNIRASGKGSKDAPELRDYMISGIQMKELVRAFRNLDCHVIYTAIGDYKQDPRTKKYKALPSLVGKLAQEIPAIVDTVGFLEVEEDKNGDLIRYLWLSQGENHLAKVRVEGGFKDLGIEEPVAGKMLNLLFGKNYSY